MDHILPLQAVSAAPCCYNKYNSSYGILSDGCTTANSNFFYIALSEGSPVSKKLALYGD